MLNVSTDPNAEERRRVIEDLGRFFVQFGLTPTLGRIWGYLLLSPRPASLDLISADLGISKSGASVAARQLEQFLLVRRSGQPGSRRALYEATAATERFFDQMLAAYRPLVRLLDTAAGVSPDDVVRARLVEMSRFMGSWIHEFEQLARRLSEQRR